MTAEEIRGGLADLTFRALDRFGVPCVVLAVILYFGREAAIALHDTLVRPVVKSHVEFLEATSETLSEMCEVQKQQAQALDDLAEGQRDLLRGRVEPTYKTSVIIPDEFPKN